MRKFISAAKENLPLGFDPESFTERPIATVRESAGTIEVDYLFPGYYLIDDTRMVDGETIDFKQVVIANTGIISQSGRPALPSFGRYLRVPPGRAFKASVWTSPEHSVERNVRVFPAQMLLMDNPEVKTRFEYDKAFYDRETVYPKEMVSITGPYEIARKQGLLLHVSPFVYNPSTRQLAFHEKFRITISLTEPVARGKPQWGVRAWEAGGPLDNLFLNPGKGDGEGTASHAFFQKGYPETEFLIVYAQPFEKAARMLADWKNSRGIPTEIHSLDDMVTIGFNLGAHGGDMRALKKAIRHAWLEAFPFLRYILLLGDTDQIPIETIPSPVYGANHTDYYYSTGKGPEPPDSPLVFPVLALGRIPVRPDAKGRDSHAVFVIKKIIDYEKNPPSDSAYYKRMVFASSFENEPNTSTPPGHETRGCMEASEFVCSRLENRGYRIERVYLTNIPDATLYYSDHTVIQQPVRGQIKYSRAANNAADATEALKKALAQGQLFVSYRGHGGSCEWSFPSLSGDDVDKVPACPPSAVFSLCCNTGMFTASQPCLADMFLAMNGGGVPSLIASTTESDAAMNNDFIKALFDGAFGNILSLRHPMTRKIRRIGDLMNYAKKCIPLLRRDADTLIRDHFEVYHVIGDPTLELWTEPPLWFAVTAFLEEDELKIRLEPCPPECRVTLRSGLEVMARVNPLTGEATVVPREGVKFGAAANHVTVCCWAPGYLYNEVKLPIPGK